MKTLKYRSKHFGFQLLIPDSWSSPLIDLFLRSLTAIRYLGNPSGIVSDTRTLTGPNGKYFNIVITPLSEDEAEPTIADTKRFFEGYAYRQNLNVMAAGTINVANKEHFWATFFRMGHGKVVLFKKFSLLLNRAEYLITAGLGSVSSGEKPPDNQIARENEADYDQVVTSFKLVVD